MHCQRKYTPNPPCTSVYPVTATYTNAEGIVVVDYDQRILILTMHDDPQYLHQALKYGASGYVLKKAADAELLSAMRGVLRSELYVQPSMTRILLEDMLPESQSINEEEDVWGSLSEREQEVLKMVALGHISAEIASQLNLSAKTVEPYRTRGMEKLGMRTRAALVRFALQKGLIKGD